MATIVADILRLAQPSLVLDMADFREVCKLAEVCKEWLYQSTQLWILGRLQERLLAQYGSDCTPLQTRRRYVTCLGELKAARSGKQTDEYLIERLFIVDRERCRIHSKQKR